MKLERLELRRIALDLVTPFRTSFGVETHRDILLLRVTTDVGEGWGECVASHEPAYSSEFVDGSALVITQHLWPALVVQAGDRVAADVAPALRALQGPPDGEGGARDGGARRRAARTRARACRPSLGAHARPHPERGQRRDLRHARRAARARSSGYIADGYVRIKLKIEPGWDVEPVRLVRELIGPDVPLQVDANTAYRRDDIAHLCKLDEFDLLLIEQPLPEEDILGHAELARALGARRSASTSRSCRPRPRSTRSSSEPPRSSTSSPAGSAATSKRCASTTCASSAASRCGAAAWSRPASAAPPTPAWPRCPGFTLPGDISASTRFYARDIVLDPITVDDGHVAVPTTPGPRLRARPRLPRQHHDVHGRAHRLTQRVVRQALLRR